MCLAVPGKLTQISNDEPLLRHGRVDFGGVFKEVSLAVLPDAAVGEYVLVHAGIAISRVDEAEAQRVFEYIREIDQLEELGGPAA
jgi:hydrogenase expression/formation protein HypC